MPLLAFNITAAQVTLPAGNPAPVLPASPNPPERGVAVDVTKELSGLSNPEFAALEAQRSGVVEYEWTGDAEFPLGVLTGNVTTFAVDPHAADHTAGGPDALQAAAQTATNQSFVATNQNATATNQTATTGVSTQGEVAVNNSATTGLAVDTQVATNQTYRTVHHEIFLAPEVVGTSLGIIAENVSFIGPSAQPSHPTNLAVTWDAGWNGGNVRVNGFGADGVAISETFTANPGGITVGAKGFAYIGENGIVNLSPGGGGGDVAIVETGADIGLAIPVGSSFTLIKTTVNNVHQNSAGADFTERTYTPPGGSEKDGARNYNVWYYVDHTHVQDTHAHTVTDGGHNHTQNSHSHGITDTGHTHVQDAHTHVQDAHTHMQDAHIHDLEEP